jgi:hypothetical protein
VSRMKRRLLASAIAASLAVLAAAAAFSSPRPGPASIFSPEKGKFRILVNGQEVGSENFEISRSGDNWIARGDTDIKSAGNEMQVSGTLKLHSDGTPVHYQWSTKGAKKASSTISFSGPTATIELRLAGAKPYTQQFTFKSPQIVVLDNNLYDHYAVLARLYDWNKKGTQTFSVLVPQELTPGTVTVQSFGSQDIDGKKLQELRVNTEDLEVDLYLDGRRLVRLVAPSNNAEIVRE